MAKYLKFLRIRTAAEEEEDGRSRDPPPPAAKNSGQGRDRERKVKRFWTDRETTSDPEIGMVVYVASPVAAAVVVGVGEIIMSENDKLGL